MAEIAASLVSLNNARTRAQADGAGRSDLCPTTVLDAEVLRSKAGGSPPSEVYSFELHGQRLSLITGALGEFVKVRSLDLSCNEISELPPAVLKRLSELRELNLGTNCLWGLKWVQGLTPRLQTLDLSDNKIDDVSPLAAVTGLTVLSLEGNRLSSLKGLGGLSELRTLNLARNRMTEIGPALKGKDKLTELNLSRNGLKTFAGIENLHALEELDLSSNRLEEPQQRKGVPGPLQRMSKLTSLNLSNNRLAGVSMLGCLPKVTDLYLRGNCLGGAAAGESKSEMGGAAGSAVSIFDGDFGEAEYGSEEDAAPPSSRRVSTARTPQSTRAPSTAGSALSAGGNRGLLRQIVKSCPGLELLDLRDNAGALEGYSTLAALERLTTLSELSLAGSLATPAPSLTAHRDEVVKVLPKVLVLDGEELGDAFTRQQPPSTPIRTPAASRPNTGGGEVEAERVPPRPGTAGQRPTSAGGMVGTAGRRRAGYSNKAGEVRGDLEEAMAKLHEMHAKAVSSSAALSRASRTLPMNVDDLPRAVSAVSAALNGEPIPDWRGSATSPPAVRPPPSTPPPGRSSASPVTPPRGGGSPAQQTPTPPRTDSSRGFQRRTEGKKPVAAETRRSTAKQTAKQPTGWPSRTGSGNMSDLKRSGSLGAKPSFGEEARIMAKQLKEREEAQRDERLYHSVGKRQGTPTSLSMSEQGIDEEEEEEDEVAPTPMSSVGVQAGDAGPVHAVSRPGPARAVGQAATSTAVGTDTQTEPIAVGTGPAATSTAVGTDIQTEAMAVGTDPPSEIRMVDVQTNARPVPSLALPPRSPPQDGAPRERTPPSAGAAGGRDSSSSPDMVPEEGSNALVVAGGDWRGSAPSSQASTPLAGGGGFVSAGGRAVLGILQPGTGTGTGVDCGMAGLRPGTPATPTSAPGKKVVLGAGRGMRAKRVSVQGKDAQTPTSAPGQSPAQRRSLAESAGGRGSAGVAGAPATQKRASAPGQSPAAQRRSLAESAGVAGSPATLTPTSAPGQSTAVQRRGSLGEGAGGRASAGGTPTSAASRGMPLNLGAIQRRQLAPQVRSTTTKVRSLNRK
eukprot:Hpha_TRINITY_DN16065_c2_g5::TRINITY_DN16065_c2_g5_i1::g.117280::m.117280